MAKDKQDRKWRSQRKRACKKLARITGKAVVYRNGKPVYEATGKPVNAVRGARTILKPAA